MAFLSDARRKLERSVSGHALDHSWKYSSNDSGEHSRAVQHGVLHHHHSSQPITEDLLKRFVQDSVLPVLQDGISILQHDSRKELQLLSERLQHDLRKALIQVVDEVANKDRGQQKSKRIVESDLRQTGKVVDDEPPMTFTHSRSSVAVPSTNRLDRVLNDKMEALKANDNRVVVENVGESRAIEKVPSIPSSNAFAKLTPREKSVPRKKPLFLQDLGANEDPPEPMDSAPTLPLQVLETTEHIATRSPKVVEAWLTAESVNSELHLPASTMRSRGSTMSQSMTLKAGRVQLTTPRSCVSGMSDSSPSPLKLVRQGTFTSHRQSGRSTESRISDRRLADAKKKTARAQDLAGKRCVDLTAEEFLTSTNFDNCIGVMILLNAVTIGIQTDYMAKNVTDIAPWYFSVFEYFFLVIFTSELTLRIYVYRLHFFVMKKHRMWNWFDTIVVVAQLTEEILLVIARSSDWDDEQLGSFRLTRVLRALRVIRILRVMRVLHLITELRTIVSSIVGSMRSLLWTLLLLLLMIYIVGVYFTQSVSEHMVDKASVEGYSFNTHEQEMNEMFGSLARTILTLYEAMSGGIDWDSIADPMIREIGWFYGLALAGYVAFATLALLNVVITTDKAMA